MNRLRAQLLWARRGWGRQRGAPQVGPRRRRRGDQRGSVLVLVPAGFLVLLLLGGISVDSAAAILGQRQLADVTADAANDAATEGLSGATFYRAGALQVDPASAARVVCTVVAADGDGDLHDLRLEVAVGGATVAVRGSAQVDAVFGRNIPRFATRTVSAGAEATAAEDEGAAAGAVSPDQWIPVSS